MFQFHYQHLFDRALHAGDVGTKLTGTTAPKYTYTRGPFGMCRATARQDEEEEDEEEEEEEDVAEKDDEDTCNSLYNYARSMLSSSEGSEDRSTPRK